MHRRISVVPLFAAITLAACSPDAIAPAKAPLSPKFSMGASQESGSYIVLTDRTLSADGVAARVAAVGGTLMSYHAGTGLAVVSGVSQSGASDLALSGVGKVQADFAVAPDAPSAATEADASDIANVSIQSQTNPAGAGRFNFQWNMRLINAPAAWTAGKLGSSGVTVAIIDTGLDYDAPDLNGLVDLSRSKSFMNHYVFGRQDDTTTVADEYTPIVPSDDAIVGFFPGRNLVTDLNGHGTNVATQVSSKAAALAGVTSRTTLIGVKVLGANGYGAFSDILNGVLWAADHGADVANMSLGGGFSKSGNGDALEAINLVFNYAKEKGMAIVVAAGNSGINLHYIGNSFSTYCDAPHVICVAAVGPRLATTSGDEPAYYTNFGKNNVDIAAPGGNQDAANGFTRSRWPWSPPAPAPLTGNDAASWVWSYCAKQTIVIQKAADGIHGDLFVTACLAGNRLTGYIGTSQAAPHVPGLAALLAAEPGYKGRPEKIKQQIQRSADTINRDFGRGRINVGHALGL